MGVRVSQGSVSSNQPTLRAISMKIMNQKVAATHLKGLAVRPLKFLNSQRGFCINTLALLIFFTAINDRVYNANCLVIQGFVLMRETANETAVLGGPWQDPVPTTPLASRDGTAVWLQVPRVEPEG